MIPVHQNRHQTPIDVGACSMVRGNMLLKTVVTGSPQRRNAARPPAWRTATLTSSAWRVPASHWPWR